MNNIYIQDKLDAFRKFQEENGIFIKYLGEETQLKFTMYDDFLFQSLTDYHNHIVEKILHYYQENILYIGNEIPESLARISDMDRYVMLGLPADIQKILQDTNQKEYESK